MQWDGTVITRFVSACYGRSNEGSGEFLHVRIRTEFLKLPNVVTRSYGTLLVVHVGTVRVQSTETGIVPLIVPRSSHHLPVLPTTHPLCRVRTLGDRAALS
jgi:hypothetical protein